MRGLKFCLPAIAILAAVGCAPRDDASRGAQRNDASLDRIQETRVLRWGADVIGGIPYVYEDPTAPKTYIGFELEIAEAIAQQLGVEQQLVIRAWDTLIPELQRRSFDMAMNGIEDTEDRERIVLFSEPYFVYSQQITVRKEAAGIDTLDDLPGKTVGTLSGTAAEDILRGMAGVSVVAKPEIIYSYADLEAGRVDAVLLDTPIAAAYGATNPKLKNVGESFGEGRYVIAFRTEDKALKAAVDDALATLKANGTLRIIFEKYGIMDGHQATIGIL